MNCDQLSVVTLAVAEEKEAREVEGMARTRKKAPKYLDEKVRKEVKEMMAKSDFSSATPLHFLALHDELHRHVYGVEDATILGYGLNPAKSQVQGLLTSMGSEILLDFIRWAWLEEKRREAWRRENHRDGSHLTARFLFSRPKVTEYRISLARRHSK